MTQTGTTIDPRQCLTSEDVARLTSIAPETLRTWRHRGKGGPPSFKIGGRVVYLACDVNDWIDAQYAATRVNVYS